MIKGTVRQLTAQCENYGYKRPLKIQDNFTSDSGYLGYSDTFAEKLARIKRRAVPDECFRDKGLMSRWIDGNK